ncbi:MAG: PQQ-dependent sugar dehydrogenase [Gemmatimonadaceae bacterium]
MRVCRSSAAAFVALVAITPACSAQGTTTAAMSGGELAGSLSMPAGFKAQYFAKELRGVRFMALGPDGAVYATQPGAGRVVRLWDVSGDGLADSVRVVIDGQRQPHGLAFHDGWLYIANTDAVVRVKLDRFGVAQGAPEKLANITPGGGHWTRTVIFGADGKMYVAVGSSCNLCVEKDSDRAAVLRFDADGKNGRIFSRGLRNAVGIAVRPGSNEVWASQNERDNIQPDHENLPPEELNILRDGGDFGWPYCYSVKAQPMPNPEYHDADRCAKTLPAALDLPPHTAPLGLSFLSNATLFPADYRGDLLVALHGSWNRTVPVGAKVIRVHIESGKPVSQDDFITGWQDASGKRWGRPVDVLVNKDGSVLISDDSSGSIYRISH